MHRLKYMAGVDGLRAIAVLSVVLFHLGVSGFSGGFVGVDVFFVISGFLITRLIVSEVDKTGGFSFSNFYSRRVRRLFPALFVTLLITTVAAFVLFSPQHFQRFGGELVYSIFSASNFFFWNESGYFNTASEFKPLLHTWSLSVEEQFYLVWPVMLVFLAKRKTRTPLFLCLSLAFALSLFASFVMSDGHSDVLSAWMPKFAALFSDGPGTIFFLAPFRIFEFAIGAASVWLVNGAFKNPWVKELACAIGLALIGYSIFWFSEKTLFPSYNALIPCVGAALVICSSDSRFLGGVLSSKIPVFVGLVSYSVYLVHWPIIVFYKYYTMGPLNAVDQLVLFIACMVLGYILYRFVETPLRAPRTKKEGLSQAAFGLACAMLAMVLVLPAASIWASDGWKWRTDMPSEIAAQLKDSKQFHVDQYGGSGYQYVGWISGGESGVADMVLIGDSHALQYATGLDSLIGKPLGKNIFISASSCIPLPGMTRVTPDLDWDKLCPGVLETAMAVINKSPNAVVFLAEAWDGQLRVSGTLNPKAPTPGANTVDGYKYITGKIDEFRALLGTRELVVVGNVPGAGTVDAISCFSRPSFIKYDCATKLSQKEESISTVPGNMVLKSYASERQGVTYISPYEVFCTGGLCKSFSEGEAFYSDGFHLSKAGSKKFVEHYKSVLVQKMEASKLVNASM
ncbi:acyltransferase family protein [Pseudomonas laurylsulfatiphila]|nr:acyltransferase family protein [Pseudomonas laurylsulfatiphila]